ncbi:FAD binding domain-containing protein [Oceanicella actignis]|uniref:Carbon-monoxide dehydrogenase medium subunit n=1 Tax=Oceanicella actignis TaxID=1189325 RepID=A0A1M7T7R8_9RHOB|nr:xanthine dehydrogenase family protein subunit M [Oceanicella actignis]TYO90914.1 carbon monoxide dehydrogenase medium subunit [Oceanicella actignis]SET48522.1 carbon monoxide dehydrogenase, medium subunit [Oceanicella actignis]SHN66769.1 carbon-monoxide dehydrogenase medium subunit [Oceanicella actignis]
MIPAGFEYHRPTDVASAVAILGRHGDEARVLAGGHSLIPMMKLRMAAPAHLVDLRGIAELGRIEIGDDAVVIGAMVAQHDLIAHEGLAQALPIIREAALQIADPQVRSMGTIGGNLANGDPGNDMPGLMQCLDARFALVGPGGEREVAAREFYESAYFTAREDDEILTRVIVPRPPAGAGWAYEKIKRKIGDYATAAAAVMLGEGFASVAMTNLADTPVWCEAAGRALAAGDVEGCVAAMLEAIDPAEDNRGPVAFKKHAAAAALRRAIARAQARRA